MAIGLKKKLGIKLFTYCEVFVFLKRSNFRLVVVAAVVKPSVVIPSLKVFPPSFPSSLSCSPDMIVAIFYVSFSDRQVAVLEHHYTLEGTTTPPTAEALSGPRRSPMMEAEALLVVDG